jgi:hypothetical protein
VSYVTPLAISSWRLADHDEILSAIRHGA